MLTDTPQGGESCWNHFMVEKSPSKLGQQDVMWPTGAGLCHRGEDRGGGGKSQGDPDMHGFKLHLTSSTHQYQKFSVCVLTVPHFPHLSLYPLYFCLTLRWRRAPRKSVWQSSLTSSSGWVRFACMCHYLACSELSHKAASAANLYFVYWTLSTSLAGF